MERVTFAFLPLLCCDGQSVCLLCCSDTERSDGSVCEQQVHSLQHTKLNASDNEHYHQPAEGDEGNKADHQELQQEQKSNKEDQNSEYEKNNNKTVSCSVRDQDEEEEEEEFRDSAEPEDTEQVETFFSTMSHRYERAPLEGQVL